MSTVKKSRLRKPKNMETKNRRVYAGILDKGMVYIGAPYYGDYAQIHIRDSADVDHLARWLAKASLWLKERGE